MNKFKIEKASSNYPREVASNDRRVNRCRPCVTGRMVEQRQELHRERTSALCAVAGPRVPGLQRVDRHFAPNTEVVRDTSLRAATSSIGGQGRAKHDRVRLWSSDIAEGMWSQG
jgi:hypothetical protein